MGRAATAARGWQRCVAPSTAWTRTADAWRWSGAACTASGRQRRRGIERGEGGGRRGPARRRTGRSRARQRRPRGQGSLRCRRPSPFLRLLCCRLSRLPPPPPFAGAATPFACAAPCPRPRVLPPPSVSAVARLPGRRRLCSLPPFLSLWCRSCAPCSSATKAQVATRERRGRQSCDGRRRRPTPTPPPPPRGHLLLSPLLPPARLPTSPSPSPPPSPRPSLPLPSPPLPFLPRPARLPWR